MRRANYGGQSKGSVLNGSRLSSLPQRFDQNAYNPAEFYSVLVELFAKLRRELGEPQLDQYVRQLQRYVKQLLSAYELSKEVTVVRSVEDILAGNTRSETKKSYVPHVSTINALLILRSLENGWAAPDAQAGLRLGDAVKTMLADRIEAAVQARKTPMSNSNGFREDSQSRYNGLQRKYSLRRITSTDLFESFHNSGHFLGGETEKLLRLKCHSDFYQKLRKTLVKKPESADADVPEEKPDVSSEIVQEVLIHESFCNVSCVAACANISIATTTNISVFLGAIPASAPADKTSEESPRKTIPAHSTSATARPTRPVPPPIRPLKKSELQGLLPSRPRVPDTVTVDPAHVQVRSESNDKPGKRKRADLSHNTEPMGSDSSLSTKMPSRKAARMEPKPFSPSERAGSSDESTEERTTVKSDKLTRLAKQSLQHSPKSSVLPASTGGQKRFEHDLSPMISKPRQRHSMPSMLPASSSEELFSSKPHSRRTTQPVRPTAGLMSSHDRSELQKAQAIIEAWKSSSYEVLPTEPDLFDTEHEPIPARPRRRQYKGVDPISVSFDSSQKSAETLPERTVTRRSHARTCSPPAESVRSKDSEVGAVPVPNPKPFPSATPDEEVTSRPTRRSAEDEKVKKLPSIVPPKGRESLQRHRKGHSPVETSSAEEVTISRPPESEETVPNVPKQRGRPRKSTKADPPTIPSNVQESGRSIRSGAAKHISGTSMEPGTSLETRKTISKDSVENPTRLKDTKLQETTKSSEDITYPTEEPSGLKRASKTRKLRISFEETTPSTSQALLKERKGASGKEEQSRPSRSFRSSSLAAGKDTLEVDKFRETRSRVDRSSSQQGSLDRKATVKRTHPSPSSQSSSETAELVRKRDTRSGKVGRKGALRHQSSQSSIEVVSEHEGKSEAHPKKRSLSRKRGEQPETVESISPRLLRSSNQSSGVEVLSNDESLETHTRAKTSLKPRGRKVVDREKRPKSTRTLQTSSQSSPEDTSEPDTLMGRSRARFRRQRGAPVETKPLGKTAEPDARRQRLPRRNVEVASSGEESAEEAAKSRKSSLRHRV
ncbi:unnamed protein product [Nippostrongylus brasiliensis]|uniref:ULP_PROTEASE domain-containing protein n=1 Tax=Nippostrongylus brasiliensis TaxID=27835 RepID=A0A0N4Y313_NIPBR|nr:unnamed protein product [Nippostrongylus brasiliensis]